MEKQAEIEAKRQAATRARRLSLEVARPADRDRILAFAAELDAQADVLERHAAPPVA